MADSPSDELCKRGHPRGPENDIINKKGYRECRQCRTDGYRRSCLRYRQTEKYRAAYERRRVVEKARIAADPAAHRAKRRVWELKAKFGLTRDAYDAMLREQGGSCAICRARFSETPCVDHDHATGAVRGLLCTPCNKALGMLSDDPSRADRAAAYLREHGR